VSASAGETAQERFEPLTREQAQAFRVANPPLSPWRVVAVQAAVGLAVVALAVAITGRLAVGGSALYGAAAVVLPSALMAYGMTRRLDGVSAAAGAARFVVWQVLKVVLTVLMLVLAPWVVRPLDWLALLAGLVVCLKVYWFALLWRGRRTT
jgi:ATP synthase protein I